MERLKICNPMPASEAKAAWGEETIETKSLGEAIYINLKNNKTK